ncbi:MAG: DNA polymerase III subunit beta [Atopobiaceae bacterium]|jgi:DNA polymerase-3 subunit beta|nr:DNA polymerase III subunit beta [Atopobiaceae bacterium]
MKFTVSQSALSRALSVVSKGIGAQATLPILAGIHMSAHAGSIEFQTTNMNISIRHSIPANVEDEGDTVVSGKILSNVVKNLPDSAVTFDDTTGSMNISCEKSHFRLNTLDPADFPEFPVFDLDQTVELPSDLLSSMVDKVYKVTSKDTSRPILAGVLLTVEDNTIRLVATDSYRLAVCDTNTETAGVDAKFEAIVPGSTFHDVLALPSMTDRVSIGLAASQIVFSFGSTTYVSRRIEGNFPNFRQLLPATCNSTVKLDAASLSQALRRVSVIATSNPSVRFDVDADGGLLKLSASSPDQGESTELIDVEVDGGSMSIALNFHYVLDCVSASAQDKDVSLELLSSMQPAVFKSYANINYLYLLMPVRM